MSNTPQLHLENQICFQLYSLSRLVTQSYQPLLKPLGLTYPQYLVLLVLWQKHEESALPCPVKEITEPLLLDTGTVTPLLKRMEERGMLIRTKAKDDERKVLVALTDSGVELKEKAAAIPLQLLCNLDVPVEQVGELHQQLGNMLKLVTEKN